MREIHVIVMVISIFGFFTSKAQPKKEQFRFSLIQSTPKSQWMPGIYPFGIEFEYSLRRSKESRLGLGFSSAYQNHGMIDYPGFITSHNMYSLDLSLTFDVIKFKKFTAFLRGSFGLSRFATRSFYGTNELGHILSIISLLNDDNYDDIETEPLVVLKKFSSINRAFSGSFTLQWNLNEEKALFAEMGYRNLGDVKLIENNKVLVDNAGIRYIPTYQKLELLTFKVGYCYSF